MAKAITLTGVEEVLRRNFAKTESEIKRRIEQYNKVATGDTIKSFEVNVFGYKAKLLGASYIEAVEKGRKAGKVPRNMTEILMRWIRAKGLSFKDDKDLERWANAIKWKIIRTGTLQFRSGKVLNIMGEPTDKLADNIQGEISELLQSDVARLLFENNI